MLVDWSLLEEISESYAALASGRPGAVAGNRACSLPNRRLARQWSTERCGNPGQFDYLGS